MEGSDWDAQLHRAAGYRGPLGGHNAPGVGWHGNLDTELHAISRVLAECVHRLRAVVHAIGANQGKHDRPIGAAGLFALQTACRESDGAFDPKAPHNLVSNPSLANI
jgi:hypothetical protein